MSDRRSKKAAEIVLTGGDDFSGPLRALIDQSGQTRYEISHASGVPESVLSRCYTGKRPATLETLRAVAESLGHRVTVRLERERPSRDANRG